MRKSTYDEDKEEVWEQVGTFRISREVRTKLKIKSCSKKEF